MAEAASERSRLIRQVDPLIDGFLAAVLASERLSLIGKLGSFQPGLAVPSIGYARNRESIRKRLRRRAHRTYYSGVERGFRNVSQVNIEKLARGLKKSLAELFTRV